MIPLPAGRDMAAVGVTLAIGTVGGMTGYLLHLPLGLLLGSLSCVGVVAAAGWRPFGHGAYLPPRLRMSFVPVIGVAIGGAFTPDILAEAPKWGWSLAGLLVFLPLAHLVGFTLFVRGGLDRQTAFYGAVPGGLIESITLAEEAGAEVRTVVVLQFLRLILTIVTVPLAFLALTGQSVGSASGAVLPGSNVMLEWRDVAVLLAAGGIGAVLGYGLRLPGWMITGPIIVSALAHATELTRAVPPGWLVGAVQVILGAGLGARFAGVGRRTLMLAARLAATNAMAALMLALGFALALHGLVGEPLAATFLAYAPGGLAEMSLIALSLQMSVVYVTVHHVARIVLAVMLARLGGRYL